MLRELQAGLELLVPVLRALSHRLRGPRKLALLLAGQHAQHLCELSVVHLSRAVCVHPRQHGAELVRGQRVAQVQKQRL